MRKKRPALSKAETARRRYLWLLGSVFAAFWLALAIHPIDRSAWLLENALLVAGLGVLMVSYRAFPLSRVSYTTICIFLCLHTIGAHYTYSEVPWREWLAALTGGEASLEGRNHFDRVVHFSYGLLLAYPIREVFLRIANVRGFWGYFLPLDLTMSTSMLYELLEWAAASLFGGGLGTAFLAPQGDEWDAQKDMALAALGALLAMTTIALINARSKRDFAAEWADSLRVKQKKPLE